MGLKKRIQEHMTASADKFQQRADECVLLIDRQQRQDRPDGGLITMLEIHAAHWQALADGARSVAHAEDRQRVARAAQHGDGGR
jgi:hypothetical protein